MSKFIELVVSEDDESKKIIVNVASIGRAYANPQNANKSIVELSYQSINDAPVFLEADISYEALKNLLMK